MDNKTNYLELLDNNRQQFTQYNAADFKADTKHAEESCFEALRKRTVRRERKLMPTPLRRTIRQRVTNKLIVEGKQRLIADTMRLMQYEPSDRLVWIGSSTDLMEMARLTYLANVVRRPDGHPQTLRYIVLRLCRSLNMPPKTFYRLSYKAVGRKGTFMPTMLWRYCWRLYHLNMPYPLITQVLQLEKKKGKVKSEKSIGPIRPISPPNQKNINLKKIIS